MANWNWLWTAGARQRMPNLLDSGKAGFYTLRSFEMKELARAGDSLKGEVVGEFSLLLANDQTHGRITGITT